MMNSTMPDEDEEANRLPENTLQRRESDGIFKTTTTNNNHSRLSTVSRQWDTERKGYLTTSQRLARTADKDGKGYLSAEEARSMGSQIANLTDQYRKVQQRLKRVLLLLVVLCGATITTAYFAITGNQETMVDENGALLAADGGTQVSVKSLGLKIFTYTMPSTSTTSGSKVCLSADDLALAWTENENGGVATFVIQSVGGGGAEQVLRLGASDARMTEEKVSFGDLELVPDPECAILSDDTTSDESSSSRSSSMVGRSNGATADDSNRRLRENVQALREGRDIQRQLWGIVAFSFSDGDLC